MKIKNLIFCCLLMMIIQTSLNAQLLYNNGVNITITNGVVVYVNGVVQNQSGQISVDDVSGISEIIIMDDFINGSTAGGNGYYRVYGDWLNNNTFNAGTGTVFMQGGNQILGGSVSTTFYNLTLDGTDIKTQTIDQYCTSILDLNDVELSTATFGFYMQNTAVAAILYGNGFVSSLNGGFLSRKTNVAQNYIFPVGSSVGTLRYRPVELRPTTVTANTYTVRMANVDATTETFDRDAREADICEINPLFYHQINRTAGTAITDLNIYYDNTADGVWEGISNWSLAPDQWEIIAGSNTASGVPLYKATALAWNDFSQIPYALYASVPDAIAGGGSICEGEDIMLTETGGDAVSWSWDGPDSFTSTDQNPVISPAGLAANGFYSVTVTNAHGCTNSDGLTIKVDAAVDATITAAGPFCETDAPVTLTAASSGGTWSGTGITDPATGEFTPTGAVGDNVITYDVTNGACSDSDTETIHVDTQVDATITAAGPFCESDAPVTLVAATAGGLWSGTGITNPATGEFTPSGVIGDNIVTYDIVNGACSDLDTETIHVDSDVDATITPAGPFCISDAPVTLVAGSAGGTWSGTGITNPATGEFTPSGAAGDNLITYNVVNGACSDTDDETIHVDTDVDATITPAGPYCETNAPVTLVAATAGGTWSGTGITNASTGEFTPTGAAGDNLITYNVVNGACSDTDDETVHVDTDVDATITPAGPFCESGIPVTLVAVSVGGTWSGNGITNPATGEFTPGSASIGDNVITYDVTNGACSDSDTETIPVDSDVDATITPIGPFCSADAPVALVAVTPGGIWAGAGVVGSNFDPSVAGDGTHNITYNITNGACSDNDNIDVTVNETPAIPVTSVDCTGGEDQGIITVTSPVGANFEYTIDGTYQASPVFGPLVNGSYTVTVQDITSGCTSVGTGDNLDCGCPTPTTLTLSSYTGEVCGLDPQTIAGNTFGGSATQVTLGHNGDGDLDQTTINASPFSFTYTPDAADAGSVVTITVTTDNPAGPPCSSNVKTYLLTVYPIPDVTVGNSTPLCDGGSMTLTETGGDAVDWSWAGPNLYTSTDHNPVISGITPATHNGTYTVTITDVNSCTNSGNVDITVNLNPVITLGSNSPICEGDDIHLTETGGEATSWTWTGPNGAVPSVQNPDILAAVPADGGTYTVVVSDINSCTSTDDIVVVVDTDVDATITTTGPFCESEGLITLTAVTAGGVWSGTGVSGDTFDPSIGEGDYTISYVVTNGACSDNDDVDIHVDTDVDATITPAGPYCDTDGDVTLIAATPGGTWSGTGIIDVNTGIFSTAAASCDNNTVSYNVANGACSDNDDIIIHVDCMPDATITLAGPFCESGSPVTLTAATSGGTWSGTGITNTSTGEFTPTGLAGDNVITYTLVDGACTNFDTETIHVDTDVDATITPIGPFCESEDPVALTAVTGGGTWAGDGVDGNNFDPEIAGPGVHNITYDVSNGACSASDDVDITVNANPTAPVTSIDCTGGEDQGIITVTAPLGANYEYTIDGSYQASVTFGPLTNGNYTVTVEDITTSCTTAGIQNVLDCGCFNPPTLVLSANSGNLCPGSDITVSGNTFGGSATEVGLIHNGGGTLDVATVSSSPFSFTYTPAPADAGTTITITLTTDNPDGAPCVAAEQTYLLTVYADLPSVTAGSNSPVCVGEDINLTETGGDAISWDWEGPNGFTSDIQNPDLTSATIDAAGLYTVTVTDNHGCENSGDVTVVVNPLPTVPVVNIDCSGGSDNGIITITSPVGAEYEYSIVTGNFQASPVFGTLTNGSYTITVNDINTGCSVEGNIIDLNCSGCSDPTTLVLSSDSDATCVETEVTISGNTFGGSATQVTLSHDGDGDLDQTTIGSSPFSFTYTPDAADAGSTVTITVTTDNPLGGSCTETVEEFEITVYNIPTANAGGNSPVCQGEDVNLTETGGDAVNWAWSGPESYTSNLQNPIIDNVSVSAAGTYTVQITDTHGCIATDDYDLTVYSSPSVIAGSNSPICQDEDINLTETGGDALTWAWTGPNGYTSTDQNPVISNASLLALGTYSVVVTDANGCFGTDDIVVLVIADAIADITEPGTICSDGSAITLEAVPAGGIWSGDGVDPLTGTFDPIESGTGDIEIIYTVAGSCGDADTIHITVMPRADASITDPVDSVFVIDPAVTFTASEIGGLWSGTAIDEFTGEFVPVDAGVGSYWIVYTITSVCGDIDSTLVTVMPEIIPDILIPDVLTPNNDGYNDTWRIQGIKAYEDVEIVIFNRWGDEVFMFTGTGNAYAEVQNQWDGIRNGKELPFGTYVYLLVLNNEDTYKGTVTIIR